MEEMLTVAEFLSRYKVSRTSFYREVNRGRIPLRKFGTASRIARGDAEAWANSLPIREAAEDAGQHRIEARRSKLTIRAR